MKSFNIIEYSGLYFDIWNDFVDKSKNATFLFNRNFMDYHGDRFVDSSLLIYKNDKLIALFPANRVGDVLISHQGLTYGGLLCLPKIRLEEYIDLFYNLLLFLNEKGITKIQIKNIPYIYNKFPTEEFEYVSFLTEGVIFRKDVLLMLEQNNRMPFSKNRKRVIQKGNANDFYVEENGDFASFWEKVLIPNLNSKYNVNPVHTLAEIEYLHKRFPKEIRQFNVYNKEGNIVAGVTIFETEKVAHLQYCSGIKEWNSAGAIDLLHDYLINDVFKDKQFFDFGSCNEEQGRKLNNGLLYWKECFGARSIVQNFHELETKNYEKLIDIWT